MADLIKWLSDGINSTFIYENRYKVFLTGLGNTLSIAFFATIIGVIFGIVFAIVKVYAADNKKKGILIFIADKFISMYLTVFRGTPILVQLMIWYFIVFTFINNAVIVAIIGVGLNSAAYVTEIVRSGIMSIDFGQTEAGRSLGLSRFATMCYIILPQAFKNILPALGNEFISLLKETSVVGTITVVDITKASQLVKAKTYDAFFPIITSALVYLILVMIISLIIKNVEGRLRKGDKRS